MAANFHNVCVVSAVPCSFNNPTSADQVPLSSFFNVLAFANDATTFTGTAMPGTTNALSAQQLGPSPFYAGADAFALGTANSNNGVSCTGQTVPIPQGPPHPSRRLAILALANGNQLCQTFTLHLADGTSQQFTQSFSGNLVVRNVRLCHH